MSRNSMRQTRSLPHTTLAHSASVALGLSDLGRSCKWEALLLSRCLRYEQVERGIAAALATHLAPWVECYGSMGGFSEANALETLVVLRRQLDLDDPVLICAFIFVERCILAANNRTLVTPSNWEALLVTATLLAMKVRRAIPPAAESHACMQARFALAFGHLHAHARAAARVPRRRVQVGLDEDMNLRAFRHQLRNHFDLDGIAQLEIEMCLLLRFRLVITSKVRRARVARAFGAGLQRSRGCIRAPRASRQLFFDYEVALHDLGMRRIEADRLCLRAPRVLRLEHVASSTCSHSYATRHPRRRGQTQPVTVTNAMANCIGIELKLTQKGMSSPSHA